MSNKETGLTFGEAIEALKADHCVQRVGWNGKDMHLYLERDLSFSLPDVKAAGVFRGTTRTYEPVICMFTAQGKHQPGWLANQADMLAEDWQIVRPS